MHLNYLNRSWLGRLSVLSVVVLLGLLAATQAARAHSGLLVAVPGPGQEVGGEIDRLQLYFGEPLDSVSVRVLDPSNSDISGDYDEPVVGLIEVEVPRLENEGVYVVDYEVDYLDGASFASTYQFTFRADAPAPLPLEFEGVDDDSSLTATMALWVLVGSSIVLVLLLAWRLRQLQLQRHGEE